MTAVMIAIAAVINPTVELDVPWTSLKKNGIAITHA